jgi:hypothetical protein
MLIFKYLQENNEILRDFLKIFEVSLTVEDKAPIGFTMIAWIKYLKNYVISV